MKQLQFQLFYLLISVSQMYCLKIMKLNTYVWSFIGL